MRLLLAIALSLFAGSAHADCALNVKTKTHWEKIGDRVIILKGGIGPDILVEFLSYVGSTSQLVVLKNTFCSFERNAILVDNRIGQISNVSNLD